MIGPLLFNVMSSLAAEFQKSVSLGQPWYMESDIPQ